MNYEVEMKRLQRKLRKKEIKIAAMERYITKLESEVAKRAIDLPKSIEEAVQRGLCNVRMIPVLGLGESKIVEVRNENFRTKENK